MLSRFHRNLSPTSAKYGSALCGRSKTLREACAFSRLMTFKFVNNFPPLLAGSRNISPAAYSS